MGKSKASHQVPDALLVDDTCAWTQERLRAGQVREHAELLLDSFVRCARARARVAFARRHGQLVGDREQRALVEQRGKHLLRLDAQVSYAKQGLASARKQPARWSKVVKLGGLWGVVLLVSACAILALGHLLVDPSYLNLILPTISTVGEEEALLSRELIRLGASLSAAGQVNFVAAFEKAQQVAFGVAGVLIIAQGVAQMVARSGWWKPVFLLADLAVAMAFYTIRTPSLDTIHPAVLAASGMEFSICAAHFAMCWSLGNIAHNIRSELARPAPRAHRSMLRAFAAASGETERDLQLIADVAQSRSWGAAEQQDAEELAVASAQVVYFSHLSKCLQEQEQDYDELLKQYAEALH